MKTEKVLSQLKGVKQTKKNQWMALCPAHNDTNPSLSIKKDGNRTLLYCFAGCEYQEIIKYIRRIK